MAKIISISLLASIFFFLELNSRKSFVKCDANLTISKRSSPVAESDVYFGLEHGNYTGNSYPTTDSFKGSSSSRNFSSVELSVEDEIVFYDSYVDDGKLKSSSDLQTRPGNLEVEQEDYVQNSVQYQELIRHEVQIENKVTSESNLEGSLQEIFAASSKSSAPFHGQEWRSFHSVHLEENSLTFSIKNYEAKKTVLQSIVGYMFVNILDLARMAERLFRNLLVVAFQPHYATPTLSSDILMLLDSFDANFDNYAEIFVLNLSTAWKVFLKTQSPEIQIEFLGETAKFLRNLDSYLENVKGSVRQSVSLNDAFNAVVKEVRIFVDIFARWSYSEFSNEAKAGEEFVFAEALLQTCSPKSRNGNHFEKIAKALENSINFVGNFIDKYVVDVDAKSLLSSFNSGIVHQITDFACYCAAEVMGLPVTSDAANVKSNSRDDQRLFNAQRSKFDDWKPIYGVLSLFDRFKELSVMTKRWPVPKLVQSLREALEVAWLTLFQSDSGDEIGSLNARLSTEKEDSFEKLHAKCFNIMSGLQDFHGSWATDVENLIRNLLKEAEDLKCHSLGPSDPILRRLQFLLRRLESRRRVETDPYDPLNVAKARMEAALWGAV